MDDALNAVDSDLLRTKELVGLIMETSPIGIVVVDRQGMIAYTNRSAEEVFGLSKAELRQRTYNAAQWRITDYEGRPVPDAELPFRRVMDSGRPVYNARLAVQWSGSRRVLLRINGAPLRDGADQLIGMVAVVEDVTQQFLDHQALQASEERFRQLLESTPDAMLIVDGQGRIVVANGRAVEMFGYGREELLGSEIELLVPEASRSAHCRLRAEFHEHPRLRTMGIGMELAARRKDGGEFPVEVSLRPIVTGEGTLISAAVRDISHRKRIEQELKEQETQLLAAQRIQEHLLPQGVPVVPGFEIAGASYPAVFAAGDYFDYLPLRDECLGIVIGDVSGHGVGPALLMASLSALLRVLVQTHEDLGEVLARANGLLIDEVEEGRFITLIFAVLDPRRRTLAYANAGHPAGYILDASGRIKARLESTTWPLAVDRQTPFPVSAPYGLETGDLVLLITDGILEAIAPDYKLFGPQRLLETVRANLTRPAAEIIERIHLAVREFSGRAKLEDDVTIVAVRVLPPPR